MKKNLNCFRKHIKVSKEKKSVNEGFFKAKKDLKCCGYRKKGNRVKKRSNKHNVRRKSQEKAKKKERKTQTKVFKN